LPEGSLQRQQGIRRILKSLPACNVATLLELSYLWHPLGPGRMRRCVGKLVDILHVLAENPELAGKLSSLPRTQNVNTDRITSEQTGLPEDWKAQVTGRMHHIGSPLRMQDPQVMEYHPFMESDDISFGHNEVVNQTMTTRGGSRSVSSRGSVEQSSSPPSEREICPTPLARSQSGVGYSRTGPARRIQLSPPPKGNDAAPAVSASRFRHSSGTFARC